jgi:hypothetical protein
MSERVGEGLVENVVPAESPKEDVVEIPDAPGPGVPSPPVPDARGGDVTTDLSTDSSEAPEG